MWPDWPASTLLLIGPPGAGKSHLGAIWASRANAAILGPAENLAEATRASSQPILLEDCDRRNGSDADFFHLLNTLKENHRALVMTARMPPDRWGLATADLLSRLRQSPIAVLQQVDEPLIRAVMVKLFADRQLTVDVDVVAFAARNIDRSFEAVEAFARAIDEASLSSGKRVTRALAAHVISALGRTDAQGPI